MISEIGGYSGLLLGVSMMDLAAIIQSISEYFINRS